MLMKMEMRIRVIERDLGRTRGGVMKRFLAFSQLGRFHRVAKSPNLPLGVRICS
jgi:hypothetical protein